MSALIKLCTRSVLITYEIGKILAADDVLMFTIQYDVPSSVGRYHYFICIWYYKFKTVFGVSWYFDLTIGVMSYIWYIVSINCYVTILIIM